MNFQDAIKKVREYHRQYGLPAADAPRLLPTDGLKANAPVCRPDRPLDGD
jgi:hypothetical protein